MKMKKIVKATISLVLLIGANFVIVNAQNYEVQILGSWKEVKREQTNQKKPATWNDKPYKPYLIYEFRKNGICVNSSFKPDILEDPYQIKGNILRIGELRYLI